MPSLLNKYLPPTPLARRLALQSMLSALGDGIFLTGSAVYFTQIVGISATQVGIGLSAAMGAQFLLSLPLGKLVDRIGPRQVWAAAAFSTAALYAVWPFVSGFVAFLGVMIGIEIAGTAGRSGRGAYSIGAISREERVRSLAFMRSALNIGFTLGAFIGGIALAFDNDDVVRGVPLLTAALLALNGYFVTRMPPYERRQSPPAAAEEPKRGATRNRGFIALFTLDGVLSTHQVLLNAVIPLWLVEETDAPRVLLAWLFATNTVMAVLLQVAATRGVDSVHTSLRASRRSAILFVFSCGIVMVTHDTIGWATICLIWLGHVTVTGAELYQSAGHWGLVTELSDHDRLGEYQGLAQLGATLGGVWAPAAYTFLALQWGTPGWIIIAGIIGAAAIAMHPAARSAQRFLDSLPTKPDTAPATSS